MAGLGKSEWNTMNNRNKLRIIHLTTDSAIGGTERMILQTACGLNKDRFESVVISLMPGGPLGEMCEKNNIPFFTPCFKSKTDFGALIRLVYYLRKNKGDILHTYLFHSNILGRIIGKLIGYKYIISSQRNVDLWRKWYHDYIDKMTSSLCSVIVSNSIAGKKYLVEQAGIKEDKVVVIHNGLDVEKYPVREKNIGILNIINIASLTEKKGHKYLFDAISKLAQSGVDFKLYLIGKGKLENYLRYKSKELGLDDKIFFEGYSDNITSYLQNADIFVLPSLWEGLPVALMEAMACGVACIASDVGDVKELIKNEEDGLIVEPKNVDQITNSILRLINDRDFMERIGSSARKKIKKYFSSVKMINSFEKLYNQIVEG